MSANLLFLSLLAQISICRDLPNIEVITFSVNGISDLEPLHQCQNLSELYLRRNNIRSLDELFYLKTLPRLRVLWLAENPCCGLVIALAVSLAAVTEEELSQALVDGVEITAPPARSPVENGWSSTAGATTEPQSQLLSCCLEDTSKTQDELDMKLVPRDKYSSFSTQETDCSCKKSNNVLDAILLLMKELDAEELEIIQQTVARRLQALQKKELQEE
uniref:Cilia and flagella associated protein 410 n=1 Tax=Zonotrichia albicollis TaxID=44394 RepID=A0A8D2MG31_ZONAL